MLSAGDLPHKIVIEYPVHEQDSYGSDEVNWLTFASVWAGKAPFSAKEFTAAKALHSKLTARFTIRYREDITAEMRIIHRGKIYNIEGVLPDKESGLEYITLPVSEGVRI